MKDLLLLTGSFLERTADSVLTYLTVAVGFVADADFMTLGAAVLLIAKLIQELPKAYRAVFGGKDG